MKLGLTMLIFYLAQSPLALADDRASLQGRWFKSCQAGSVKTEWFAEDSVTLNEMYFQDQACRQPSLIFISSGSYTLPTSGQMDFRFAHVSIRLMSKTLIEDFNRRKVCGFEDWVLGSDKEISGRSCEIFVIGLPQKVPAAGDMRYGIYRLHGGQLSLGQLTHEKNGTSPARRPLDYQSRSYARMARIRP
jgi:hypothetical protein